MNYIEATPYARPYLDAETRALIEAEGIAAGLAGCYIGADRPSGPFVAQVSDDVVTVTMRGATPLAAFRAAVDKLRRTAAYGELGA